MEYFDAHVHYSLPITRDNLDSVLKENDISACNIVTVPNFRKIFAIPDALAYKYTHPKCYVFSSLEFAEYRKGAPRVGVGLVRHIKFTMKAGCDGVKMIEGKPEFRKMFPIPDFDSNTFDPFWRYMNKKQIPIIFHVNDPEELWIPKEPDSNDWFYDDTYVKNEDQYTQVLNVLMRYPNLKIIFPHFFFLAKYLDTLSKILDEFPNVCIDIAPGIELFRELSAQPEKAREFFEKYKTRIIFGTDMGLTAVSTNQDKISRDESAVRVELCKRFLSEDGVFELEKDRKNLADTERAKLHGLGLDEETRQLICRDNFINFVGKEPNRVKPNRVISLCNSIKTRIMHIKMPENEKTKQIEEINSLIWFFKNISKKDKEAK